VPSFSDLAGGEGFAFQTFLLRAGLRSSTRLAKSCFAGQEKDQRMLKVCVRLISPVVASFGILYSAQAQYAYEVADYVPGQGVNSSFTNPASALGEPSRITPAPFGGPVDPFDPPFKPSQLVSVGTGGSLTVRFRTPILNHPLNRFGIDFIIFGNAGFIITNEFDLTTFDWIGTPATDGSLFGDNSGASQVSVSRDGINFYPLDPAKAPTVDGLAPTDGGGDFHIPIDPTLTADDFAGLTLEQIRAFYHGAAGGSGYDIAWAQDDQGHSVFLPEISYVRIEVISGHSEIDGVSAVLAPSTRSR